MNDVTGTATNTNLDYQALEELVIGNSDLERLEVELDKFNMFEAIGATWQDTPHSNLLAFLLNPQANHRLGDVFLKQFLQRSVMTAYDVSVPVSAIDLDIWDMEHLVVLRKEQRMDLLLLDERHRLAIIIENKLIGKGNATQLQMSWNTVSQSHPGWSILGIYLTPDGEPSPDERYVSLDYIALCTLIEGLVESRGSKLDRDVALMLSHYTEMLRRHIVGESEITKLCRRIYGRHQRAFDLIYQHRLSRQNTIRNIIKLLVDQKQGLILDHSQDRYIGFAIQQWEVPKLVENSGSSHPGRMLLFQFDTWLDTIPLSLFIGTGSEKVRQRLIEVANANQPPFLVDDKQPSNADWYKVFERSFLTSEFYESATADELADKIVENWTEFLKQTLPALQAVLEKEDWLWK